MLLGHLVQARSHVLDERVSRSGESTTPKREFEEGLMGCLTCRLGEKFCYGQKVVSPKQEFEVCLFELLAQAR